jgi:hypothetical protein
MNSQNLIKKTVFLVLFVFTVAMNSFAQSAYTGKDFILAFGKNDVHTYLRYQIAGTNTWDTVQLILRITAIEDAKVSIKFTENSGLNANITVTAGEIRDYKLSYNQAEASYTSLAYNQHPGYEFMKSIVVSSTGYINLIAVSTATRSTEATLVMPIENLGTEYMIMGLDPSSNSHTSGFILVATENNTLVEFPNDPGMPSRTLKAGQVYPYVSGLYDSAMGMIIKTSKPVACFLNGTKVKLTGPKPQNYYRENYNLEQLPPVSQWGTHFIVPTVRTDFQNREAIFARIHTKEQTNKIQIKYTDGTSTTYNFPYYPKHYDLKINSGNNPNIKAAYVIADHPVSVCLFHSPNSFDPDGVYGDASQPGVAWLPPVGQTISRALVSPLDLNAKHVYLRMSHDFIIITRTATKNNTTVSFNGGAPQNLTTTPQFSWIADNIGDSGYSLGRYKFGEHNPQQNLYLKTIADVENPDGILLLAYGQGSYTNYFYSVGAGARKLDIAFYINDIHYEDINGRVFCGIDKFNFELVTAMTPASGTFLKWYVDGKEQTTSPNASNQYKWNKTLPPGDYTIEMRFWDNNSKDHVLTTGFTVKGHKATAINIIGEDASVCVGGSIDLKDLVTHTSDIENPKFHWYHNERSTTELPTTIVSPKTTTTNSVSAEGSSHCEGEANFNGRKAITIYVSSPSTKSNIALSNATTCSGTSVALTATPVGVNMPVFRWYNSLADTTPFYVGATYHTPTTLPVGNKTYYVSVAGTNFCEGGASARESVTVTVKPTLEPSATITITIE